MSTYSLVQRGVINITSADGVSPKDETLGTSVKTPSSFLTNSVKQVRRTSKITKVVVTAVAADGAGPKDTVISAVILDRTYLAATILVDRTGTQQSATVDLTTTTNLRLKWAGVLAGGDTVEAVVFIVEQVPNDNVTIRLFDADTIRAEWDGGALLAGESIDISYEVFDIENLGDDIKEGLWRQKRILAFHGENSIEDLIIYDDAGNPVTYRIRTFDSKVNAEAAKIDIPDADPLELGEISRVGVIQDFNVETNDRKSIIMTLIKGPLVSPDIN